MYINDEIDYLVYLKNKKVYIWGAGERGVKCAFDLKKNGIEICGFIDNDVQKAGTFIDGATVIGFCDFIHINDAESMIVICAAKEQEIRRQLLEHSIYNFISQNQIDFGGGEEYYNEEYFKWQQRMGEFGGRIKKAMFEPYIKPEMTVLEFGSGGGFLLRELNAGKKLGIEINKTAREHAKKLGVASVEKISDVADEFADVVISSSVLEHVENPLGALRELRRKLKVGGLIVFHVPNESCETEYSRSEVNNHLYTWNCLNLGNLFKAAGYFVVSVERIQEVWPENYEKIEKEWGREVFDAICKIGGRAYDANRCLIVARRTS